MTTQTFPDLPAPPIAEHAVIAPARRPDRLGAVHLIQLLLAEAAVVVVLAAVTSRSVVAAGIAASVVLLLAVAIARRGKRWWVERWLIVRAHRRRVRRGPPLPHTDARLAAMRFLAPDLTVTDVSLADSTRVGVAHDGAGRFAAAAVLPRPATADDPGGVPLDVVATVLADNAQPGAVLQVVTHTVPAPSSDTHPSSPVGHSYRMLLSRLGGESVPADRSVWLLVRLDDRALAEAGNDQVDADAAAKMVAVLVRRVVKALRRVGISHRLLDSAALLDALTRSCDLESGDLDPGTAGADRTHPREEWTSWHSASLAHRTYWLREWPSADQAGAVLGSLSSVPAAMTSVSIVLSPQPDDVTDLRALVRVAAPAHELAAACQFMVLRAASAGARLFPLDGEHAPAVYASAPTGGGPR